MSIGAKLKEKFKSVNVAAIITVAGVGVASYFVYQYLKRKLPADRPESYPAAFELPQPVPEKKAKTERAAKPARKTKRQKVYSPELGLPNPMNPFGSGQRLRGYDGGMSGLAEMACGDDPNCTCGLAELACGDDPNCTCGLY